jgi:hypothetical protein
MLLTVPEQQSLNRPSSFVVLSTVGQDGYPNAIPVGSLVARSQDTLLFALRVSLGSLANLRRDPRVAVLHLDGETRIRIKGHAAVGGQFSEPVGFFEAPFAVVRVRVDLVEPILARAEVPPLSYYTWNQEHLQALLNVREYLLGLPLDVLPALPPDVSSALPSTPPTGREPR